MCSLIQLCPHQTVTCSKCLQMFSSCVRGYHYDFVVNDTWMVSFKNSSGPLMLQLWGWDRRQAQCSQPALPVAAMQNKCSSHIGWTGCGNQITAWALAALAKVFPSYGWGEKEATKLLVSNQLMLQHWSTLCCGVHEGTFYRDITLAGNYSGTKEENMPVFCWEVQECDSNFSCRRGDT